MTTIIWNFGKLYADSRITRTKYIGPLETTIKHDDTAVKIIEPKNMVVGKQKVLAIGVAGDATWLNLLPELDRFVGELGVKFDLSDRSSYTGVFNRDDCVSYSKFTCVTAKRIFVISLDKNDLTVSEHLPISSIIIGSVPDDIKIELVDLPPVLAMEKAAQIDSQTGGNARVWEYGKTGIVEYVMASKPRSFSIGKYFELINQIIRAIKVIRIYRTLYRDNPAFV